MTEPTDTASRIAAYLDGQMEAADVAAFEAELESDPALAATLARWLGNDEMLRAAFAGPIENGADAGLIARMGLAEPAAPSAANDNPASWQRWRWPAAAAMAAAVALAVLVSVPRGGGSDLAALDRLASRESAEIGGGATLSPTLTVRAADGRYCREFVRGGGREPGRGIACRAPDGWKLEAFARSAEAAADPTRIVTAGGPENAALDAAYARLGASDPLGSVQEHEVIGRNWK